LILEYLFSEPISVKDEITSYAKSIASVNLEIKDVKDTDIWLASFKVNSEDDNSALTLSKINEEITKKYNVTILTNESAFYYNKMLYPLVNKFERDLRKLLYLASKLSSDSSDEKTIHNLEGMVFGDLFDLIFTDKEFINNVKVKVNSKSWKYNKNEIINNLNEIEENTLWKRLLGLKIAPTLQNNYIKIKNYRNSVMHAHNITTEDYSSANEIYLTIIQELEDAIDNIINNKIVLENIQTFNDTIVVAIDNERMSNLTDSMDTYTERFKELNTPDFSGIMVAYVERLKELRDMQDFSGIMTAYTEKLKELNTLDFSGITAAHREQLNKIDNINSENQSSENNSSDE